MLKNIIFAFLDAFFRHLETFKRIRYCNWRLLQPSQCLDAWSGHLLVPCLL